MEWVRFDVSGVPPQGGYVAKQCPVRAQCDVLEPAAPSPPGDAARRRMDAGNAFEAEVFAELAARVPGAVVIERGGAEDRRDRERRTIRAMDDGAAVVIGGRLPIDEAGRRVGEPDVLVAADGAGYHPVDVKHHTTLTDRRQLAARVGDLASPELAAASVVEDRYARKNKADLLQLAHYRRLLQACGHAAPSGDAAIVGSERLVTWYDLDEAIWQTPSLSEGRKMRSTMDVYDFEFAFRLDIIEVARRHRQDPSVDLLVVPVRTGECAGCPWWSHCEGLLTERDDVSLVPYSGWRPWRAHRDHGVGTIAELASLDRRIADLVERGVDVADLLAKVDGRDDDEHIERIVDARRHAQVDELIRAGVHTAGDARRLDPRAAAYSDVSLRGFAESIDLARARRSDAAVLLRRGVRGIDVRRADVEIDLDLENTVDGVYLWGALVTDRAGTGLVESGSRSFVTWDPDPSSTEVEVFEQMSAWLRGVQESLRAAGHSLAVYCFNEKAEAGAMRRLAATARAGSDLSGWVDELVGSSDWVDLLAVAREHLITGVSMGLKYLAPLAGFEWDDEDPGGEQSMEWHRIAVADADPEVRRSHRSRILTYNRNDVEATLALRRWMVDEGAALARLEDLDAG